MVTSIKENWKKLQVKVGMEEEIVYKKELLWKMTDESTLLLFQATVSWKDVSLLLFQAAIFL